MRGLFATTTGRVILLVAIVIVPVLAWNASTAATSIRAEQERVALGVAASHLDEIVVTRRWVAEHAGVWVIATPGVEPNPYLPEGERELEAADGTRLVRVNPAYLVRLTDELLARERGVSVRVTAFEPLNPENAPDEWESQALTRFIASLADSEPIYAIVDVDGAPVLRYAIPLAHEESCAGCHVDSITTVGEVRGTLSLTMAYAPFADAADDLVRRSYLRILALGALAFALVGLLGSMLVRTEARLRDANESLAEANAELERQSAAKTRFLGTMSHELRTPLNSIIGFSGILSMGMAGDLSPEQRKQVGIINSAGKQLVALINDILDLSKIEAGRIVLVAEEFAAAAVLDGVVDIVRPLAEERGLELRVSTAGAEGTLYSDRRRIEQVLINLVANAIKHTDSGYVAISVVPGVDEVTFVVEDTGVGLSAIEVEGIFEEFPQVAADARQTRGAGIGLMISRTLARLLGGELTVESEPGCGSVFTFRVPRRLPEAPAQET